MRQLEAGQFYSSSGVQLADVVVEEGRLEVHIEPRANFRYTTAFIGSGGVNSRCRWTTPPCTT